MIPRYIIYAAIPVISALIGWMTNYLAVKMIFRPRKPVSILGIKVVGLIPKRQSDLARKIGETVEKELISQKDIHKVVTGEDFQRQIMNVLIDKVEEFLYKSLGENPLIAMMLTGEVAARIKEMVRTELKKQLPEVMENLFESVEKRLDFKAIIQERIEGFDLSRLENIVYSIAANELRSIEILGGVLGFVVGVVQVGIIVLTGA